MYRLICLTITLLLTTVAVAEEVPYEVTEVASFNEPWAIAEVDTKIWIDRLR